MSEQEIQKVRAVFVEPNTEGAQGLWVAADPKGSLHLLPMDRALGCFGLTRAAAVQLRGLLDEWLRGELPESDRIGWDGKRFCLREKDPPLAAPEPTDTELGYEGDV